MGSFRWLQCSGNERKKKITKSALIEVSSLSVFLAKDRDFRFFKSGQQLSIFPGSNIYM